MIAIVRRARRRSTQVAGFALLALVGELTGRSVTLRLDRIFAVRPRVAPVASYYPFLLAGIRIAAALALAAVAWRLVRAQLAASAGESTAARPRPSPSGRAAAPGLGHAAALAGGLRRHRPLVPDPERRRARLRRRVGRCSRRGSTPTRCRSSPWSRCWSPSAGPPCATGSPRSSGTPRRRSRSPAAACASVRPLLLSVAAVRATTALPASLFGESFDSRPPPLPA